MANHQVNVIIRARDQASRKLGVIDRAFGRLHSTVLNLFGAAGIGYALISSARAAAAFGKQMAMVSTMLDEQSMRMLPKYRKELQRLAVDFGESTEALSKGLYDILSASVSPTQAMSVLSVAAKAARAGITDTAIAADVLTTILNSYGLSAGHAMSVSDKLFTIVKRGKTTFGELAPNIGKVSSLASVAGVSLNEVGAAIATMTRAGMQTDIAITGLRSILISFLKPTDEARQAAAEFGLELSSNTLKTIGLTGVLEKLKKATPEQLAKIMPKARGLAAFATAIKQVNGQLEDLDAMRDAAGRTEEAFGKMTDNAAFKLDQLGQKFIKFKRGLGVTVFHITEILGKAFDTFGGSKIGLPPEATSSNPLRDELRQLFTGTIPGHEELFNNLRRSEEVAADMVDEMDELPEVIKKANEKLKETLTITDSITTITSKFAQELKERVDFFGLEGFELKLEKLHQGIYKLPGPELMKALPQLAKLEELFAKLKSQQAAADLAEETTQIQDNFKALGERIFEATRTPLEKHEAYMIHLDEMLKRQAIDWDTYSRAVSRAKGELDGLTNNRLPMREVRFLTFSAGRSRAKDYTQKTAEHARKSSVILGGMHTTLKEINSRLGQPREWESRPLTVSNFN